VIISSSQALPELAHTSTALFRSYRISCAHLEAVQILRNNICSHAVVVDDVSTIFRMISHAARAGTLIVVLGTLLGGELELPYPAEQGGCRLHDVTMLLSKL
jgi:hypothetical protein